jgi:Haem-degrading
MTEVVTAVSRAAGADAREAHPGFGVYDSGGDALLGGAARLRLVTETDAHEGPVYVPGEDALYFTTLPSKDFEDQAAHGRPSALHLARAVPLQGGMPIAHAGHVAGAVGVSGASSADEDQELSMRAAEAASAAARDGAPEGDGRAPAQPAVAQR